MHRGLFPKVTRAKVRPYVRPTPPGGGGVDPENLGNKGFLRRFLGNKGGKEGKPPPKAAGSKCMQVHARRLFRAASIKLARRRLIFFGFEIPRCIFVKEI